MIFLANLINGLSLGSVYAIIALGYTMVYGISKMLNFAHGDVIMVGAYISFCGTSYLGLPAWVSVVLAMAVCTAFVFRSMDKFYHHWAVDPVVLVQWFRPIVTIVITLILSSICYAVLHRDNMKLAL